MNPRSGPAANRYVALPVRTWDALSEVGLSLPPSPAGLYVRLATAPEATRIPGVIRIGKAALAEALGWRVDVLMRCVQTLEPVGLLVADWDDRVIYLPELMKEECSRPSSPSGAALFGRELADLPRGPLVERIDSDLRALLSGLHSSYIDSYLARKRTEDPRGGPRPPARQAAELEAGPPARLEARPLALALALDLEPAPAPDLSTPLPPKGGGTPKGIHEEAPRVLSALSSARKRVQPAARDLRPTAENLKLISDRLRGGNTVEECLAVVEVCEAECRRDRQAFQWFNAVSPFRPENFARKLARAGVRVPAAPGEKDPYADLPDYDDLVEQLNARPTGRDT